MTVLHVVRHGQSTWNAARLLQGQAAGIGLSELGHQQARDAAELLAGVPLDALYSSDLLRAGQTAAVLATRLGLTVQSCPGLRERAYGSLEGRPSADAAALAGDLDWTDPDARPGGGESLRDVHTRVGAAVARIADAHPGGSVVLVSHGDTIRVLAARLAGLGPHEVPWRDVANGSLTVLHARSASDSGTARPIAR